MGWEFPLPILFQNGERVKVRGGYERRSKRPPLTPARKNGEREKRRKFGRTLE
jgi:hypothetical protein